MTRALGRLLGIENAASIDRIDLTLAAPWAEGSAFWIFLVGVGLFAASLLFYGRLQQQGPRWARLTLGVFRGVLLAMLVITLADPVLELGIVSHQRPLVYLVFDGTESMAIEDELPAGERAAIERSVQYEPAAKSNSRPARVDYVRSMLRMKNNNLLARIAKNGQAEVEAFAFEGHTTSRLRKLALGPGNRGITPSHVADQITTSGQVTALGAALEELNQQHGSSRLAGVILLSDFVHNSGPSPLAGGSQSPAMRAGVPIYTVGVGANEAVDLAIDFQTDPKMKKAERSSIQVQVRQSGLEGHTATIRLAAKKLGADSANGGAEIAIGQRTTTLRGPAEIIDFPYTPEDSGRFEFIATVEPQEGEVAVQNNRAAREVNIIDDYLRLMYVAYEPTWEWRFIKEVFHRDKLVGMEGFRTFLSSSDPKVREANILFLPALTPSRGDFFANDVLFVDDMPRTALSDRFCEMTKEYVSNLGGGLVVVAGPRFGPRDLQQTPLADMLPVILDQAADLHSAPEHAEFRPRLTALAERYSFMQLGADAAENRRAWDNLGKLPWYQPVAMPHPQAEVLLEHPTDKCTDGKTPQPLVAVRKYGRGGAGEVVWIGFNETWRLRRQYGEKYYRQFWSQLIYRLGMSHALGPDKRFVARIDQQQYRAEDKVTLWVEAYDENYEPLSDESLPSRGLMAELTTPSKGGSQVQTLTIPMLRKGFFELPIAVFSPGSHQLRVKDPITGRFEELRFEVTSLSAERSRAVRDEKMQADLAQATDGRSYDLITVHQLPDDLRLRPITERSTRNMALWTTPLWFGLVVTLMLGEWLTRKIIRLA